MNLLRHWQALGQSAARRVAQRASAWSPTTRGLLWAAGAGFTFSMLNALMRSLTLHLDPFQAQFLRYLFGLLVLMPLVALQGWQRCWPRRLGPQFSRGAVHALGLCLWFTALPKIPLADMTAIGFTGPIFIMIGAWLFLKEPMRWARWLACGLGFVGVLIVVGPKLSGSGGAYHLLMLASAPVFAASFLLTKALTRHDSPTVIVVWQSLTVSLFSLPLALLHWQWLTPLQWAAFLLCGLLGSAGHYCLTRSYLAAEISATQSAKFLDLGWSALMGWLLFADVPSQSTLIGGLLICAATLWVASHEARSNRQAALTAAKLRAAAGPIA